MKINNALYNAMLLNDVVYIPPMARGHIRVIAEKLVIVASTTESTVCYMFNGIKFLVYPENSVEDVVELYGRLSQKAWDKSQKSFSIKLERFLEKLKKIISR
jgi:hypothetical protein